MLIAQITDLHIKPAGALAYGRVDTAPLLAACVAHLMAQNPRPDVVLATGDLVDAGRDDEYARLRELLAPLPMPLLLLAGNHDERAALRRAFDGPAFDYLRQDTEFVQYALALGGLRFLALDTVVPGAGHGELCERRLRWLDEQLAEDARPTIVMLHHPPFATGIPLMDALALRNPAALEEVVARHRHVERLLCGHLHRPIHCRFGGSVASTCPSPAHQLALNLQPGDRGSYILEPPGYQLHLWRDGRLVSHSVVIGDFPGPYSFGFGG